MIRSFLAPVLLLALIATACTSGEDPDAENPSSLPIPSVWTVISVDGVRVDGASLSFTRSIGESSVMLSVDDGCTSDVVTLTAFDERWTIGDGLLEPACTGPLTGLFKREAILSAVLDNQGNLEMVVGGIDILAEHFVSNSASGPIG